MAFDKINKVSMAELTPELQELINSKASQEDLNTHRNNTIIHITAQERDTWNSSLNEAKRYADTLLGNIIGSRPSDTITVIELINRKLDNTTFESFRSTLSQVAFSGSYNDLKDKPSSLSFSDQANYSLEAGHATEADHANAADNAKVADLATNANTVNNVRVEVGEATPNTSTYKTVLWFDTRDQILKCYFNGSWKATKSVW